MTRETIAPGVEIEPSNTSGLSWGYIEGDSLGAYVFTQGMVAALRRLGHQIAELQAKNKALEETPMTWTESMSTENMELAAKLETAEKVVAQLQAEISRVRDENHSLKESKLWGVSILDQRNKELVAEIERLRAICPTPWRTGCPEWKKLDPLDLVEYWTEKADRPRCNRVKHLTKDPSVWGDSDQYRIIPHVPPPKPERVYTLADLPPREGVEWSMNSLVGGYRYFVSGCVSGHEEEPLSVTFPNCATESEAVKTALRILGEPVE